MEGEEDDQVKMIQKLNERANDSAELSPNKEKLEEPINIVNNFNMLSKRVSFHN